MPCIDERYMQIYHCDRFTFSLVTEDKFLVMLVNCLGLVCLSCFGEQPSHGYGRIQFIKYIRLIKIQQVGTDTYTQVFTCALDISKPCCNGLYAIDIQS